MGATTERDRFERWSKAEMPAFCHDHDDNYLNCFVEVAWVAWQAALASHAPSGHLSLELAERDRIIKGLIADNERLVAESYIAGMGDGAKLRWASEAAAQPDGYCSKAPTAPHPQHKDCINWEPEIEHNDH